MESIGSSLMHEYCVMLMFAHITCTSLKWKNINKFHHTFGCPFRYIPFHHIGAFLICVSRGHRATQLLWWNSLSTLTVSDVFTFHILRWIGVEQYLPCIKHWYTVYIENVCQQRCFGYRITIMIGGGTIEVNMCPWPL